ncbi:NADPH-dependent F420 reductase [Rhizobium tibeticum]|uniref:NADPH-dependent F420 reductase n=1 Tax=Rhizobium tibeticum TaxID=501024 RepID=UPI003522E9F4
MMIVGIIGAGNIGAAFATALGKAGIEAVIANSRGPESLTTLVSKLGSTIRAGSLQEAAAQDIVLVAVPWSKIPGALAGLNFDGRIVIDANNSIEAPLYRPADLGGRTSTDIFTALVPGARVVKAFNHLTPKQLSGDPHSEGGRRVLFYSGNDMRAKAEVAAIIDRIGFFGIDLGALAVGSQLVQFPGGPLPALNLVKFD